MTNWRYVRYGIEERWDRLGLRRWINDNPKIICRISIVSGILFLLIVIIPLIPHTPSVHLESQKVWFYDLNTKKLFAAEGDQISPIDAPSGKLADGQSAGVKAHVFSYVDNPKESECFIGYLEKFTPEGRRLISAIQNSQGNVTGEMVRQLNRTRLVRRLVDNDWFSADSNEGQFILKQASGINNSRQRLHCYLPK